MTSHSTSPYLLDEPPTSPGKAFLSRVFAHWCVLHHGFSPEEIAAALDSDSGSDRADRSKVGAAARLMGELIASGEMRTFARPFGGESPERLKAADWELDDFRPRFARCALNPKAPYARDVDPTHWIFVELEDFNRIVEASCADVVPVRRSVAAGEFYCPPERPSVDYSMTDNRHVRMPELERRTGMSRSTIYRRIEQGRFPPQIPMDGNIAAWRETEVAEWLASPR